MSHTSTPSWLHDNTSRLHKFVRLMLFLTSFSWTFNPIQDYMGEGTPIEKIITRMLPMFIVVTYCVTCQYRERIKQMFRPGWWPLLWYIGIGILCGITSVQPALCAWKGAEIIITLMWIMTACRDADTTRREFMAFSRMIEGLLLVTVLLAFINPALGFRHSSSIIPWLQGYLPILNPNAIGFMSVIAVARLLFFPAKYKPVRLMLVAFTLLCAQSRTSYGVTCLILFIFIIEGLRTRQLLRVAIASFFGIGALFLFMGWIDTILTIFMRGQSIEEFSTLSGRTDYWAFALERSSWFGGGLATGSRSLIFVGEETFHKGTVNMHNSFIEALMGTGYVGAVPFIAMFAFNILRQGGRTLTKPSLSEATFFVMTFIFMARAMTSIVLAVFSFDFIIMMHFWAWLTYRETDNPIPQTKIRPMPVAYATTNYERAKALPENSCQHTHSE